MDNLRNQFPILSKYTYLNTARYCALPQVGIDIQRDFLNHLSEQGSWDFSKWSDLYESTREQSAELIGCMPSNVCFLPNVSLGFNTGAQYLPKRKVVCIKRDFPSVNITWESHGFEVTYVDHLLPNFTEVFFEKLSEPQQIISVSWIQSSDGFEIDPKKLFEICKDKGHLLILDGTQGLGAIPFSIDPDVDCMFLASGFKWLMAGYGVALCYVSDKILNYIKPMRGWNSGFNEKGEIHAGAKSLEVGNATYMNVSALNQGLELIQQQGVSKICEHNLKLRLMIEDFCHDAGRAFKNHPTRSSIISIDATADEYDNLAKNMIQVTKQYGSIRISPHFYNNAEDIQKMLAVIS